MSCIILAKTKTIGVSLNRVIHEAVTRNIIVTIYTYRDIDEDFLLKCSDDDFKVSHHQSQDDTLLLLQFLLRFHQSSSITNCECQVILYRLIGNNYRLNNH